MDKELLQKMALFNKFDLSGAEEEQIAAEFDRTLKLLEPLKKAALADTPIMVGPTAWLPYTGRTSAARPSPGTRYCVRRRSRRKTASPCRG